MPRQKDDPPQVFDVSKPNRVSPDATSRPLIVGHHPMMSDPMVNERPTHHHSNGEPPKITSVPVKTDDGTTLGTPSLPSASEPAPTHQLPELPILSTEKPVEPSAGQPTGPTPPLAPLEPLSSPTTPEEGNPPPTSDHPVASQVPQPIATPEIHPEANLDKDHLAGSLAVEHPPGAGPQGYRRKLLVGLTILALLLIGYGVADAKTSLPLPFYLFRPEPAPVTSVTPPPPARTPPAVTDPYVGWKTATSARAKFSIKYPATWALTQEIGTKDQVEHMAIKSSKFLISIDSFNGQDPANGGIPDTKCNDCKKTTEAQVFKAGKLGAVNLETIISTLDNGVGNAVILRLADGTYYITSPLAPGIKTNFRGISKLNSLQEYQNETPSQFAANSDLATTKLIFKSVSY